mgnify:FL=1
MATDPFRLPIPLATDEGQWAWNRPPDYPDPSDFVQELEDKLRSKQEVLEDILDMLIVGATVEDIVNTISLTAFTQGKLAPDAAEVAKLPLAALIIELAMENNVEAKIFSSLPTDADQEKTLDKLDLMQEFNPRLYKGIQEELDTQMKEQEDVDPSSFMNMEGKENVTI